MGPQKPILEKKDARPASIKGGGQTLPNTVVGKLAKKTIFQQRINREWGTAPRTSLARTEPAPQTKNLGDRGGGKRKRAGREVMS